MAKRKGPSTPSCSRARKKAAKGGRDKKDERDAREVEGGGVEDECDQLRCVVRELERERAKVSAQQRELEEQKRRLDEQLRPLRIKEEQVQRKLLPKRARLQEIENARLLDKLPKEVWEKILGEFEDAELFPMALSCRYFRQKQKELLARPRQRELEWRGSPRRASATNILRWPQKGQRASAEYLRFIRKEKVPRESTNLQKAKYVRWLAAYHGHLPLLQELLADLKTLNVQIAKNAGGPPSSQSLHFWFGF